MAQTSQGTTFTFGGGTPTAYCVSELTWSKSATEIDITTLCSTEREVEIGLVDYEITIGLFGVVTTIDVGDTGTATFTPQGGQAITLSDAIVTNVEYSVGVDAAMTTSVTIKNGASA